MDAPRLFMYKGHMHGKDNNGKMLGEISILASLDETTLQKLSDNCAWRTYSSDEEIFCYLDQSTDVYFLMSGRVRAVIFSASGKEISFTDIPSGNMFGEIAAIDRGSRSASVRAMETCRVAAMTSEAFEELLLGKPRVAIDLLKHMAAMARRLTIRVYQFNALLAPKRVQAELLRLAYEKARGENSVRLSPAPAIMDVSNRIAVNREAVSREIANLARMQIVERVSTDLWIRNIPKLEALLYENLQEPNNPDLGPGKFIN